MTHQEFIPPSQPEVHNVKNPDADAEGHAFTSNILIPERKERENSKNFLLLWFASSTNYFAYWVMQLALLLFARQLTSSPLLVGGIAFTLDIPWLLFGLLAGALVDRYDRRSILLTMTALRLITFLLAIIASVSGHITLPLLYVIALVLGVTQTMEDPALTAAVFMVVPQERLEKANAWLSGAQNIIELLAFPLGGVFASISITLSMSVGGVCATIALVALLLLHGPFRAHRTANHHIMKDVLDGVRFLWNRQVLRALGWMAGVINACWGGYLAILVLYAVAPGPVGLTATSYGLLLMSGSIGSIIGTLLTVPVQRWLGKRWAIGINILGNAAMFAAPAFTRNVWIIGAGAVLGGMASPMWTIAAASLQGRIVPTALQGRVNAAYRFLGVGSAALGPILCGLLAQNFGLQETFAICAGFTLLMIVPFFRVITEAAMTQGSESV